MYNPRIKPWNTAESPKLEVAKTPQAETDNSAAQPHSTMFCYRGVSSFPSLLDRKKGQDASEITMSRKNTSFVYSIKSNKALQDTRQQKTIQYVPKKQ